ncbi:MAG TPA: glycosyltransferase family 4 protein [Chloroflexota bacterium]|jgi:glycosyltransferase involved in cell wall biosynthesis
MRLILAHSHANTLGGGERSVLELAHGLSQDHDVRLLLGGFDPRRTYPELARFAHRRVGRLGWPLLRVRADAIVTNSFGSNLLAFRNGAQLSYWVHSTRSIFLRSQATPDLVIRRAVDWLAVRRAARLVANSQFTARKLRELYGRDADAVVYPGVDLQLYHPGAVRGGYAITVGRLSPEKGLERLLEVWRDLPEVPLHVIGGGDPHYLRELRALAPRGVTWRGQLLPVDVAELLRGASVAVFAAHGEEFGLAPLEAMASAVPVVAWRDGGLAETIVDGQTGFLVDDAVTFRHRLRLLLHDAPRRETFGAAARARAEQFSWQRTVGAMAEICASLAGRPDRAPLR